MNSLNGQAAFIAITSLAALGQVALLTTMSKRNLKRDFPIFFAYNAYAIVCAAVLLAGGFLLGASSTSYFYTYWILNSILMLFEFGIMYEVFRHAVKPYSGLIDLSALLFRWAALFLFLAAILTALATSGSNLQRCIAAINYLSRGLRLMQCGMLLLFFLFEKRLGLSWRSHSVSTALGLSTCAAVGLSLTYLRTRHPLWGMGFDLIESSTYLAVVIGWVTCFRLPQPIRKTVLDSPSKLIFQRWNDALLGSPFVAASNLAMVPGESFLPSVERTVERVMARKMTN